MNNCEHKNKMSLMYCNWCKDCGALEYLFGASPDWQLPTRTPEPTKEGESRETCQCKTPRVYHNEPRRFHGSKCVTCGKKIDMFRDSLPHAKTGLDCEFCNKPMLTLYFCPDHPQSQTGPEPTKAENGLDKLKVAIIIQQNLRHADILPKGSVDCISLKDAEHIAHKICQTFATPSITKEQDKLECGVLPSWEELATSLRNWASLPIHNDNGKRLLNTWADAIIYKSNITKEQLLAIETK